jgi:hypothetical protein
MWTDRVAELKLIACARIFQQELSLLADGFAQNAVLLSGPVT